MVDRPLIERKINQLKERKITLRSFNLRSYREFLQGPYPKAVEKLLQEMIEICLDIGKHIIADEHLPIANDSREVFQVLVSHHVITKAMLKTMEQMIGFRNILVHLYEKIEPQVVYQIYRKHLKDFDRFITQVWRYAQRKK